MRRLASPTFAIGIGLCVGLCIGNFANAETVRAAVASNFAKPMKALVAAFETDSNYKVSLATGSSGKFYAQIVQGAPFHLFLSADQQKPNALVEAQLVQPSHRYTYAVGRLALWSPKPGQAHRLKQQLLDGQYQTLAFANPRHAPYGTAAVQTLVNLALAEKTATSFGYKQRGSKRWVQGENVAQTYQFVITGHADLGFIAASQVTQDGVAVRGSSWLVPSTLHKPINQDLVLLPLGDSNPGANALFEFLRSAKAREIIAGYGYLSSQRPRSTVGNGASS